jgi:glycosyltransferase involved in cell wall biosynthesis
MVSIIIPCYNQGAYIQEAIDSVKAQTYADWEIIIVNDGSDDEETIQLLVRLKEEGLHIIDISNSGVSEARNKGIAVANGEYILPLDADDKIAPEYLEKAVKVLLEKPQVKLVYCDCEFFGMQTGICIVSAFSMQGMLFTNLIFNAALIRKIDFDKTDGYDADFILGWEDWEFWLRYIKKEEEVEKIPHTYFYYRIKNESRNSSIKDERLKICEQQLYKKHIDLFLLQNPSPITALRSYAFYKDEYEKLGVYREQLHKSLSYRLGSFLLAPFKWFAK